MAINMCETNIALSCILYSHSCRIGELIQHWQYLNSDEEYFISQYYNTIKKMETGTDDLVCVINVT